MFKNEETLCAVDGNVSAPFKLAAGQNFSGRVTSMQSLSMSVGLRHGEFPAY